MKEKIFKLWIALWVMCIMLPTVLSSFSWLPFLLMIGFSAFIFWFGLKRVCSEIYWDDIFDTGMAFTTIAFLSSMMAFLIPCSYGLEESLRWNDWCQVMVLFFLASVIAAFALILKYDSKSMGAWKYVIFVALCVIVAAFVMALLGMFGIYL